MPCPVGLAFMSYGGQVGGAALAAEWFYVLLRSTPLVERVVTLVDEPRAAIVMPPGDDRRLRGLVARAASHLASPKSEVLRGLLVRYAASFAPGD
jgi:hypothetical protein